MTFGEFQEKVGTISLIIGDEEYREIFLDYNNSELHKDDFLDAWRKMKKNNLHSTVKPQMDRAAFFGQGQTFVRNCYNVYLR